MTDIIMQAYHVLDEIKNDTVYQSIKSLDRLIANQYKEEIKNFQEARKLYDQVMADGGKFHPDFKKVTKQLSQEKRELYLKPEVIQYFELEKVFQDDLNLFLSSLSQSVSDYIKTPNKLGIVTQGGSCHVR